MIEHIAKILDGLDIQYVFEEDIVIIPYEDSDYISPNGTSNYIIFIFENPDGVLNLVLPEVFVVNEDIPELFHRLMISYTDHKILIKHRISEESNVDIYIQIPLLNQNCSVEQLEFALHTLTNSITELYKAIQHLDEKGEIDLDFLQMEETSQKTNDATKDDATKDETSQPIESVDENELLNKEEVHILTNFGCAISLFDAILLSENVESFHQLTPFIDPSLSFQDFKRDSKGVELLMQFPPLLNTVNLKKLFHYMKERIHELDASLANKLSEEAKTRFASIIKNAKELDSGNNVLPPKNEEQSKNTNSEPKQPNVEEPQQKEDSSSEQKEATDDDKTTEDIERQKEKPNFDIL